MRQLKIAHKITARESLALDKYLAEISKLPLISAEEEAGGCVLSCPLDGAVLRRVPAGVCRWVGRESQDARQGRQGAGACAGSALRTP